MPSSPPTQWDDSSAPPGATHAGLSGGVSRYRRQTLHAQGGLGLVYEARDEELGRTVALKEMQDRCADHAGSRARFAFEAEVTGNLEHPGIVPVYGLGSYPDGRPYYAMRFIHGASLEDAIADFHGGRSREPSGTESSPARLAGPTFQSLAFRQLVGRFVDVCNAVAYAHSRGVIHRDLKPANVMLGKFGETLVVDWGLARLLDRAESCERPEETRTSADQLPVSAGSMMATVQGAAVGTPAYMPPEQALGQHEEVGPGSDVYSLGATLYQLLTGKGPFTGSTLEELLEKVVRGDCPPVRQIKPGVPAALQAICLKAMASDARDRYPSARALAEEVERWLADEAVQAYPEPLMARAGRWVKRRRTLVASAAALLMSAVVFLGIIAVIEDAARRRSEKEQADTARQYERAEALRLLAHGNLARAMSAVDEMLTRLADERLNNVPDFDEERREVLQKALTLYSELLEHNSTDPEVRLETARSHVRMGDIHKLLDEDAQAGRHYDQAIELLTNLNADHPGVDRYEKALAHAHDQKGLLCWKDDHNPRRLFDAEACFHRGLPIWERLAGDDVEARSKVAIAHYRLACLLVHTGRAEEGERLFARTVQLQKELIRVASTPTALGLLGSIQNSAGAHYLRTRQWRRVEEMSRAALAIFDKLAPAHRNVLKYQYELAYAWHGLGIACAAQDRPREAEEGYRKGMAVFEELIRVHPNLPQYQEEVASSLDDWAEMYESRGQLAQAEEAYSKAVAVRRKIVEKYAKSLIYVDRLAHTYMALGKIQAHAGRGEAVRESIREALRMIEKRAGDRETYGKMLGELAGANAQAAATVARGSRPLPEREKDAEMLARQAVALLERAREAGWFKEWKNIAEVKKRADLEFLRGRDDFQLWLRRLEAGEKGR
jgi:serine/threonine-protein kinase